MTFSAFDPSGLTGITADALTLSAFGCHPVAVPTVQLSADSERQHDAVPADAELINDQARTVLEDIPVSAFVIGMLGDAEMVSVLAEIVSDYANVPLVLAPTWSGHQEDSEDDLVSACADLLIPQSDILVVSSLLASRFGDGDESEGDNDEITDPASLGRALSALGAEHTLLTGAQAPTRQIINHLYHKEALLRRDSWPRRAGVVRGANELLAASIAACLAQGMPMTDAVGHAQQYLQLALDNAYRPGMGSLMPGRPPVSQG